MAISTIGTNSLGASQVTPAKLSQPMTLGTAQASTSGTAIDFTGIPSWAKRITVMFYEMSTSGSSNIQVQVGTSGGIITSGYKGSGAYAGPGSNGVNYTTGLPLATASAGNLKSGTVVITFLSGTTWVSSTSNGQSDSNYASFGGGGIAVGGTLDRIRITTVNGTDTFDNGIVNIMYEG